MNNIRIINKYLRYKYLDNKKLFSIKINLIDEFRERKNTFMHANDIFRFDFTLNIYIIYI